MFDLIMNKVNAAISRHGMLDNCETIIAGVSGGADSVSLFFIMKEICRQRNIKLVAAHVNHMLRGKEADEDEKYVSDLCKQYNTEFRVLRKNVREFAAENGLGLEEAGRIVRYSFFQDLCKEYPRPRIAVAHNRNDRAETVMMNIFRGTGLSGLRGIPYTRNNIIRPLLDVNRSEIEELCAEMGVVPRVDSSNQEVVYKRNKIRNELFPFINEKFETDVTESLCRLSENTESDSDYMNHVARDTFKSISNVKNNEIVFKINDLLKLHKALLNRVIILSVEELHIFYNRNLGQSIEQIHVQQVLNFMKNSQSSCYLCLPGGVRIKKQYGEIIFFMEDTRKDNVLPFEYRIDITESGKNPFEINVPEAECRAFFSVKDSCVKSYSQKGYEHCFDYGKISEVINSGKMPLTLRNRREGDYINPYKGRGKCKVKKFFIDNKVPADHRGRIPLLAVGNEIIWIPGMRTSDDFKVDEATKKVLIVSIVFDNNKSGGFN